MKLLIIILLIITIVSNVVEINNELIKYTIDISQKSYYDGCVFSLKIKTNLLHKDKLKLCEIDSHFYAKKTEIRWIKNVGLSLSLAKKEQ